MRFNLAVFLVGCVAVATAKEVARRPVYSVIEIQFHGPPQSPKDSPARDIDLAVVIRHEGGKAEYTVPGFWDGDGDGGLSGDLWKVRFTPTQTGRWNIIDVQSNVPSLAGQHKRDHIIATASKHPGFWIVDNESAGRRWYRRSDGSHPYIVGNTHYSFLSGYKAGGEPTGVDIATDIRNNAFYFKKLRFTAASDRYPHPTEKPFLDHAGQPTGDGAYSYRPNPRWFQQRTDTAVETAYEVDLIADLILAGPDTPDSRAILKAEKNNGDATPYLKYIAARYGAFPNVWLCIMNEYNLRNRAYPEETIAGFGKVLRKYLPYRETPISVHPWSAVLWKFDGTGDWYDHQIIQKKRKTLASTSAFIETVWKGEDTGKPRLKPTVNDELSYQGEGDKHTEEDSLEAALGTFLGGGYSSVGFKPADKMGHYFWGGFTAEEHTAAPGLRFLREVIDRDVSFWKMSPGREIFPGLDEQFRAMAWPGNEYVLGTDAARQGIVVDLPAGTWTVTQHDVVARGSIVVAPAARGRYTFNSPASRAVLFHFKRNSR